MLSFTRLPNWLSIDFGLLQTERGRAEQPPQKTQMQFQVDFSSMLCTRIKFFVASKVPVTFTFLPLNLLTVA